MASFWRWLAYGAVVSMAGVDRAAVADQEIAYISLTCNNTVSHAPMQIRIDFTRHTVNADPAQIGDAEIR